MVMQSIASTAPYLPPARQLRLIPIYYAVTRPERGLYGNGMSCPGESDPIFIPGGEQQRGGLRACQARLADFAGDEGLTSIEGA